MKTASKLGLIGMFALGAIVAWGQTPTVIYSTIQSSPTSDVPGLPGVKFLSGTTAFSRPFRSDNGQFWAMRASTNETDPNIRQMILTGSGTAGSIALKRGDAAPWSGAGHNAGAIRERIAINDLGHFAFSINMDGTAPTTADETIAYYNGAFNVVAREGGPVPGVAGEAFGGTLDSPVLTNNGKVGFVAPGTAGGLPSTQDDFLLLDGAILAQTGIPGTPTGQVGAETWSVFNQTDFYVNAVGTKWMEAGSLTGAAASNSIVAIDNAVHLQEGQLYPGLDNPIGTTFTETIMSVEGDVWVRGTTTNSEEDYVMLNGAVVAKNNELVPGGFPGERFSDNLFSATFFEMTSNGLGDFVYGATTDYADPEFDAVIVFNDLSVILRQGDPVDVNGDGLFNDNAYIDIFNNDDMFLTDDLWLYFTAELRDAASVTIGQAFLRVRVPEPASLGLLALGGLALLRRR